MKKFKKMIAVALSIAACLTVGVKYSIEKPVSAEEPIPLPTESTVLAEPRCFIEIVSPPTKTEYQIGEPLDLSGLTVDLNYARGGEMYESELDKYNTVRENVNPLDEPETFVVDTSDFNSSQAGSYTVKIGLTKDAMNTWWYCNDVSITVTVADDFTIPDEATLRVNVIDAETGKLIETEGNKDYNVSFHTNYKVEFALITGGFSWGSMPGATSTWAYNVENPYIIDISNEPYDGFGIDSYEVEIIDLPDGYILPENYIEAVEYDNYSADIYIKLLKSTISDVKGDVNGDGEFNVADVVLFQKWILGGDVELNNWKTADLCEDGKLDVFDFCLMKRELIDSGIVKRNMTREELLEILLSKDELTWSDFEQYQSEDIGSGIYILRYEVEDGDNLYLYVSGDNMDEKPDDIYLMRSDDPCDEDAEKKDIYELRDELRGLWDEITWEISPIAYSENFIDTLEKEYIITSTKELGDYFYSIYGDVVCSENETVTEFFNKYDDEFFENNVLLMMPLLQDIYTYYSIDDVVCENGKINVYYTATTIFPVVDGDDVPLLALVTVPKSMYHAENVEWIDEIKDGYIAVFHGIADDLENETYIYKIDNGAENYGFEYINVSRSNFGVDHTESVTITGQGSLMWTDEVFTVAEANDAYDYVTVPNDEKEYTIDEFMAIFLMD